MSLNGFKEGENISIIAQEAKGLTEAQLCNDVYGQQLCYSCYVQNFDALARVRCPMSINVTHKFLHSFADFALETVEFLTCVSSGYLVPYVIVFTWVPFRNDVRDVRVNPYGIESRCSSVTGARRKNPLRQTRIVCDEVIGSYARNGAIPLINGDKRLR